MKAENGDNVKIDYTGKLDNGQVFDSSEGKEPFEFKLGDGKVIAGFEDAVLGMGEGEEKEVKIPMDKAYGAYNDKAVLIIPKDNIQGNMELKEGMGMTIQDKQSGQVMMAKVKKVDEKGVTIDLNHPLAGKDLIFKLKLVSIDKAKKGE